MPADDITRRRAVQKAVPTIGILLVPGFSLMAYASAVEPLRAANRAAEQRRLADERPRAGEERLVPGLRLEPHRALRHDEAAVGGVDRAVEALRRARAGQEAPLGGR